MCLGSKFRRDALTERLVFNGLTGICRPGLRLVLFAHGVDFGHVGNSDKWVYRGSGGARLR